nr:hypothetical protein Iba_chr07fCG4170 [Ipomoea batatas]
MIEGSTLSAWYPETIDSDSRPAKTRFETDYRINFIGRVGDGYGDFTLRAEIGYLIRNYNFGSSTSGSAAVISDRVSAVGEDERVDTPEENTSIETARRTRRSNNTAGS